MNSLAPGLKTIPSTSVPLETEISVVFETSKVAVSADPLGTVGGVQFCSGIPVTAGRIQIPGRAAGERRFEDEK
jgi:hypothetical protein